MFDLDKEVAAWSQAVHADRCRPAASAAELADHLHCEIDRARAAGLSDEEAFMLAVAKLGTVSDLAAEHAKNRGPLRTACGALMRYERGAAGARGERRALLIGHGIVWAALMVGTALLTVRNGVAKDTSWFILCILIPISWYSSDLILRRALRSQGRTKTGA